MFCSNCGENMGDGAKFCPKCGAKAGESNVGTPAQPVQQPPPQHTEYASPPPPQQQQPPPPPPQQQTPPQPAAYQPPQPAAYQPPQQSAYQQPPSTGKNAWQYFCDAFKKYAVFQGRARRAEFWFFILFYTIFSIILTVIDNYAGFMITDAQGALSTLFTLAVLLPSLAVTIRRMHDVGKSGWYCLIPIYNLVLTCTAGMPGPNQYGPDPKMTNN